MDLIRKFFRYIVELASIINAIGAIALLIGSVFAINFISKYPQVILIHNYLKENPLVATIAVLIILFDLALLILGIRYIYECICLKKHPNAYNIYIHIKYKNEPSLKKELKHILKKKNIKLRSGSSMYVDNVNNIFRLHVNTKSKTKELISNISESFIEFNKSQKINENRMSEFVVCQKNNSVNNTLFEFLYRNDKATNKDEIFLKKTMVYLCNTVTDLASLDESNLIFLWSGWRLEIPFKRLNGNLRQYPHRLHLLIQNFLDRGLCVIATERDWMDDSKSIENKFPNIGNLEDSIKKIHKILTEKMEQELSNGKPLNCRIAIFYHHYLFGSICGKPLVPYFSYGYDQQQEFYYWNTEDLAEAKTLYPEGILHVGKCYSKGSENIWVYALPDNVLTDPDRYAKAWLSCHSYENDEDAKIKDIVRRHKQKSQVHIGIRIFNEQTFNFEKKKHFVLSFDIKKLPKEISKKENEQEWQKDVQDKIKKIVEANYEVIKNSLKEFCNDLIVTKDEEATLMS
jgi:hypothetical protein